MHAASAVCTYKVRPLYSQLPIIRTVRNKYMRVSVLEGGGLSNKWHWEGAGAVGGHLEWLVAAAVTGPCTLICLGRALMYQPPYDHHGLCLQVAKMI